MTEQRQRQRSVDDALIALTPEAAARLAQADRFGRQHAGDGCDRPRHALSHVRRRAVEQDADRLQGEAATHGDDGQTDHQRGDRIGLDEEPVTPGQLGVRREREAEDHHAGAEHVGAEVERVGFQRPTVVLAGSP